MLWFTLSVPSANVIVTAPSVEVAAPVVAAVVTLRYAEILYRDVAGDAMRFVADTAAVCAVRSTLLVTAADVGKFTDTFPEASSCHVPFVVPAGAAGTELFRLMLI